METPLGSCTTTGSTVDEDVTCHMLTGKVFLCVERELVARELLIIEHRIKTGFDLFAQESLWTTKDGIDKVVIRDVSEYESTNLGTEFHVDNDNNPTTVASRPPSSSGGGVRGSSAGFGGRDSLKRDFSRCERTW